MPIATPRGRISYRPLHEINQSWQSIKWKKNEHDCAVFACTTSLTWLFDVSVAYLSGLEFDGVTPVRTVRALSGGGYTLIMFTCTSYIVGSIARHASPTAARIIVRHCYYYYRNVRMDYNLDLSRRRFSPTPGGSVLSRTSPADSLWLSRWKIYKPSPAERPIMYFKELFHL